MTPYSVKDCVPAAGPWVGRTVWGAAGTTGRRYASAAGSAAAGAGAGAVGDVDVSGSMLPAACAASGAAPG